MKNNPRTKFKKFSLLVIDKLIAEGHCYVTLRQLYAECGAVEEMERNGVRWGRQKAIELAKIRKMTGYSGVYEVVK